MSDPLPFGVARSPVACKQLCCMSSPSNKPKSGGKRWSCSQEKHVKASASAPTACHLMSIASPSSTSPSGTQHLLDCLEGVFVGLHPTATCGTVMSTVPNVEGLMI